MNQRLLAPVRTIHGHLCGRYTCCGQGCTGQSQCGSTCTATIAWQHMQGKQRTVVRTGPARATIIRVVTGPGSRYVALQPYLSPICHKCHVFVQNVRHLSACPPSHDIFTMLVPLQPNARYCSVCSLPSAWCTFILHKNSNCNRLDKTPPF